MSVAELQTAGEGADLVISSIPVESRTTPVVVVGPLLADEDIDRVRTTIYNNRIMRRERAQGRGRQGLLSSLRRRGKESMLRFADLLLVPGCVNMQATARSWQEAVTQAGTLLVKRGIATDSYVDAMVKTVLDFGPYVVVAPGIAIPHASPSSGALKLGASFLKLSSPVSFGHPHNDPVTFVIAISVPDKDIVASLLEDLTLVLLDHNARDGMLKAETAEDVVRVLKTGSAAE